jgi:hypothetical protein
MLLFGSHFDTDPQYPWTAAILKNQEWGGEMQRAEILFQKTLEYRKEVVGPHEAYALQALRNIQNLAAHPPPFSGDFVTEVRRGMTLVYPQKAAYVGPEGIDAVIHAGIEAAQGYGFVAVREVAMFCVVLLGFGHGCAADPLYPWIGGVLTDPAIASPEARAKHLEMRALTWVRDILAYSDKGARA